MNFNTAALYNGVRFFSNLAISPLLIFPMAFLIIQLSFDRWSKRKIKWDFNLSLANILQFMALSVYITVMLLSVISYTIALIIMWKADNYWRTIFMLYWIFVYYLYIVKLPNTNLRSWLIQLRKNPIARLARTYFPIELIKTVDLEPNRNYVFACFPHGIASFGLCFNMVFDISRWMKLFPRIRPRLVMLDINFCMPFTRHIFILLGFVSASKDKLLHLLCKSNDRDHPDNRDGFTSNAVCISVGGASEAMLSSPGVYKVVLKNRKGFVKLAIESGSSLVPVFCFGEVNTYEHIIAKPGTFIQRFQSLVKRLYSFHPVLVFGRSLCQETFGPLPSRTRLMQVVGAPIHVVQSAEPSPDYVDEIHQRFCDALVQLFETYKRKYADGHENLHLSIT